MAARRFMALGFVALVAVVVVIGFPRRSVCIPGDPTPLWHILVPVFAATAALVVATFAAVKTRRRWVVWACAASVGLFGGGLLLLVFVLRDLSPCLD
jgi:hypothetical protein